MFKGEVEPYLSGLFFSVCRVPGLLGSRVKGKAPVLGAPIQENPLKEIQASERALGAISWRPHIAQEMLHKWNPDDTDARQKNGERG